MDKQEVFSNYALSMIKDWMHKAKQATLANGVTIVNIYFEVK